MHDSISSRYLQTENMQQENIISLDKPIFGGQCISRTRNKKTVMVYFGIPGEEITYSVLEEKPDYVLAEISDIIKKSPERQTPPCPFHGNCGGCLYQHIDYNKQIEIKKMIVEDTLARALQKEINVSETYTADEPFHYRNNALFKCRGSGKIGFFRHDHKGVQSIDSCLIQSEAINDVYGLLRTKDLKGINRIQIRSDDNGDVVILFAMQPRKKQTVFSIAEVSSHPRVKGIQSGKRVLYGNPVLSYRLCGAEFQVSGYSFFQVNTKVTEIILENIINIIKKEDAEVAVDLYAGVGTIAFSIAPYVKKVYSVEISRTSQGDAENNLKRNKIDNVSFIHSDAEKSFEKMLQFERKPDIIILDPPRAGCSLGVVSKINMLKPGLIIYMSCDISTQARDMSSWLKNGYELERITPYDMFPQTYHVETLAVMRRNARTPAAE